MRALFGGLTFSCPRFNPTNCSRRVRMPPQKNPPPLNQSPTQSSPSQRILNKNHPQLGVGQVIKGWDAGLEGACVGEKRTLRIPPAMGYGASGAGGTIPGGATLIFETEMMGLN